MRKPLMPLALFAMLSATLGCAQQVPTSALSSSLTSSSSLSSSYHALAVKEEAQTPEIKAEETVSATTSAEAAPEIPAAVTEKPVVEQPAAVTEKPVAEQPVAVIEEPVAVTEEPALTLSAEKMATLEHKMLGLHALGKTKIKLIGFKGFVFESTPVHRMKRSAAKHSME